MRGIKDEGVGDTKVIGWGSSLAVGIGVVPVMRKTTIVPVSNQPVLK